MTGLDRVGIPNFMTVRPHDLGPGISYYNGKGTTRADAYAGAMMEAIERHAGERYDGPVSPQPTTICEASTPVSTLSRFTSRRSANTANV